jgi:hypothetical protein
MTVIIQYALDRLMERSTWLGLIAVLSASGIALSPDQAEALATVGTGLAGVVLAATRG